MSTTKNSKKQVLNLLLLKGNLYPSDSADYDLLKRRHVLIYRIPLSSLEQLKKTALTHLEIVIQNFNVLWDAFVPHLESELANIGETHSVSKHEFWLKIPADKSLEATQFIERTNRFVRRYCLRLSVDTIHEENIVKSQLRAIHNDSLNNSYPISNENLVGESVELKLTDCLKMVFTRRTFEGSPAITIQVMDKHGDDWRDNLNRLARLSGIEKEQFIELASFFLNLS